MMKSFEADVVASIPTLRRYARSLLRDPVAADDLVQDTVERALRKQHLYQPTGTVQSWLITLMRNCRIDLVRKHRSDPLHDGTEITLLPAGVEADQFTRVELKEVDAAINALDPTRRKAILMCGAMEHSYDEAAQECAVPIGTIKSRVSRAREELRLLLAEGTPATVDAPGATPQGKRAERRVLIVDDDAAFRYLLERNLRAAGYEVESTPGSIGALAMLDAGNIYDLLVIDLRLAPGEPHGFAFGRMAHLRTPRSTQIYVTAADVAEMPAAATNLVLQKTSSLEPITSRIRDLLPLN